MTKSEINTNAEDDRGHGHEFRFTVDGESLTTMSRELTPIEILDLAGVDPKTHYLVEIEGHRQISYKDDPEKGIHMRDGLDFISVSTGPTPVS